MHTSPLQGMETRVSVLVAAITSCLSSKRLAVIIDDVWDLGHLQSLDLLRDCKSSIMVTSRAAFSATMADYVSFKITDESNRAQEQAMLASYVAAEPETETVQPLLQVRSNSCTAVILRGQSFCTQCGAVPRISGQSFSCLYYKADGKEFGFCCGWQ
jgi:hypothetical protein